MWFIVVFEETHFAGLVVVICLKLVVHFGECAWFSRVVGSLNQCILEKVISLCLLTCNFPLTLRTACLNVHLVHLYIVIVMCFHVWCMRRVWALLCALGRLLFGILQRLNYLLEQVFL